MPSVIVKYGRCVNLKTNTTILMHWEHVHRTLLIERCSVSMKMKLQIPKIKFVLFTDDCDLFLC